MSTTSPSAPATRPARDDYAAWQRWVCLVGTALIVTGDLYPERGRALRQLDYRYVGTDDDGRGQDDEWFEAGVAHFEDLSRHGGIDVAQVIRVIRQAARKELS